MLLNIQIKGDYKNRNINTSVHKILYLRFCVNLFLPATKKLFLKVNFTCKVPILIIMFHLDLI
jgi:hypothetical protein